MSGILHEYLRAFHTFGISKCSATTEISLLCFHCDAFNISEIAESDISNSTVQGEYNFVIPWQQYLRERPTVIRYTYIAYIDKFRRMIIRLKCYGSVRFNQ